MYHATLLHALFNQEVKSNQKNLSMHPLETKFQSKVVFYNTKVDLNTTLLY